jgi:hypothetical protein
MYCIVPTPKINIRDDSPPRGRRDIPSPEQNRHRQQRDHRNNRFTFYYRTLHALVRCLPARWRCLLYRVTAFRIAEMALNCHRCGEREEGSNEKNRRHLSPTSRALDRAGKDGSPNLHVNHSGPIRKSHPKTTTSPLQIPKVPGKSPSQSPTQIRQTTTQSRQILRKTTTQTSQSLRQTIEI